MEEQKYSTTMESLPTEVLLHVFSFLRIPDLVELLMVSRHLRRLVQGTQGDSYNVLWARASTEGIQVDNKTIKYLEKAAQFGNKEALVKLIVAHLYSEGVPDGAGRGTEQAENGIKAAKFLVFLEALPCVRQPFSWVLVRPPFSRSFVCCKACVCNQIKNFCSDSNKKKEYADLFYVIGKAMSFHEETSERDVSLQYYKTGSELGSLYCSYEYWKGIHTTHSSPSHIDVSAIRSLRQIASEGIAINDAKFELCRQYASGRYGGLPRSLALSYISQIMSMSPPILSDKVFKIQHKINKYMMLVLVDWIVEVSEMKSFKSQTVHMALQLIQRYLLTRSLSRSRVQLLGITALLVAARWSDFTILTIREAASITDDTYSYQDVVNMIADLIAALEGDLIHPLPTDYLEVLVLFTSCDEKVDHMASYIAESCVIHVEFGGLSTAHFSAACFLLSRILLRQEFPWSSELVEVTGMRLYDLKDTVLLLYNECFSDKSVFDYRGEKLNAIQLRYADDRHHGVSDIQVMTLGELKDCLGVTPPLSPSLPPPESNPRKLFSFLSDSQYRSSDDDSIVNQSFIQDFNSHFISEPSLISAPIGGEPTVQQSSPLPNVDPSLSFNFPSLPDPLVPFMENNSITSPISSVAHSTSTGSTQCILVTQSNILSSGSSSISSNESGLSPSSSAPPPIAGISLLYSEETIGYDSNTKQHSTSLRKKKIMKQSNNKENDSRNSNSNKTSKVKMNYQQQRGRPLGKLDCNQHSFDDKSSSSVLYSKSKRKRLRSS